MLLSPNAKLLAVTDGRQAAVVVLPRSGYSKTDGEDVQVKSVRPTLRPSRTLIYALDHWR